MTKGKNNNCANINGNGLPYCSAIHRKKYDRWNSRRLKTMKPMS